MTTRLDEIRARTYAATPGPWRVHEPMDGHKPSVFVARDVGVHVPPKWYVAYLPDMAAGDSRPDAAFIAGARTDVPLLLEVVAAALESPLQCDDMCDWWATDEERCTCGRSRLRTALALLTRDTGSSVSDPAESRSVSTEPSDV